MVLMVQHEILHKIEDDMEWVWHDYDIAFNKSKFLICYDLKYKWHGL